MVTEPSESDSGTLQGTFYYFIKRQEEYDKIRPLSYPDTQVFLVAFSVVNPSSFQNIKSKWIPELKENARDVPFVLVGTKLDLRENNDVVRKLREKDMTPIYFFLIG